jgi:hypothetical protein
VADVADDAIRVVRRCPLGMARGIRMGELSLVRSSLL